MTKSTYKKKYTPEMEEAMKECYNKCIQEGQTHIRALHTIEKMLKNRFKTVRSGKSIHMKIVTMRNSPLDKFFGIKPVQEQVNVSQQDAKSVVINVKGVEITVLFRDK